MFRALRRETRVVSEANGGVEEALPPGPRMLVLGHVTAAVLAVQLFRLGLDGGPPLSCSVPNSPSARSLPRSGFWLTAAPRRARFLASRFEVGRPAPVNFSFWRSVPPLRKFRANRSASNAAS